MADENIGLRLKQARENAKFTQKQVCEKAQIPKPQTLSAYERGINSPSIETIRKLSELYKVSIDWIAFGKTPLFASPKKRGDYLVELLQIADKLGLQFGEEFAFGDPTGEYKISMMSERLRGFNELISKLCRLKNVRDVVGDKDYWLFTQQKIAEYSKDTNDFEEIEPETHENNDCRNSWDEIEPDLPF